MVYHPAKTLSRSVRPLYFLSQLRKDIKKNGYHISQFITNKPFKNILTKTLSNITPEKFWTRFFQRDITKNHLFCGHFSDSIGRSFRNNLIGSLFFLIYHKKMLIFQAPHNLISKVEN